MQRNQCYFLPYKGLPSTFLLHRWLNDDCMIFKITATHQRCIKTFIKMSFYYLFDCKKCRDHWESNSFFASHQKKQLCDLFRLKKRQKIKEEKKPLLLMSTWFKFTGTNKLFYTMETSNRQGWELWPAWDLFKTPLDLAGAYFFYLRDNTWHWSNYLFKFITRATGCLMGLSTVCFANWK